MNTTEATHIQNGHHVGPEIDTADQFVVAKVGHVGSFHNLFAKWTSLELNEAKANTAVISPADIRKRLVNQEGWDYRDKAGLERETDACELERLKSLLNNSVDFIIYDKAFNTISRRRRLVDKIGSPEESGEEIRVLPINIVFHASITTCRDRLMNGYLNPRYDRKYNPSLSRKISEGLERSFDTIMLPHPDDGESGVFLHVDTDKILDPRKVSSYVAATLLEKTTVFRK